MKLSYRSHLRWCMFAAIITLSAICGRAAAADSVGSSRPFFVNSGYDADGRSSITATLRYVGDHAYYYIDDSYLNSLDASSRAQIDQQLAVLSTEFDQNIYPKETAFWGSEPNPGIDNDARLTIILERQSSGTGGDFDSINEYPTSQAPHSNQREILTVNVLRLNSSYLKIFLAHELQHLISFNQKELLRNVSEEVWLNETRSQYAITVAGYNDAFSNSDLLSRAQTFVTSPTDSLTEWPNTNLDYASVTLFGEYLVEHYGPGILSDTLKSSLASIASINDWLASHRFSERFPEVFARWALANYVNDTSLDVRNGYTNTNLKPVRVSPGDVERLSYPNTSTFPYSLKPWQTAWYEFFPGIIPAGKNIKLSWDNPSFSVLYYDSRGTSQMLSNPVTINNSNSISWFLLIPVNSYKLSNFGSNETASALNVIFSFADQTQASSTVGPDSTPELRDGSLIRDNGAPEIYVITGNYRRYLNPGVLKLYGLDANTAVNVSDAVFARYATTNYVRTIGDKKVYTVWPDGTKHWLNISGAQFSASGRDWNSIFTINAAERDFYQTGPDITQ